MDYLELSEKLHNHLPGVEFIFSTTGLICRYGLKNTDLKLVEVKPAGQLWLKMIIAEYGKKSAPIVLFADYFNPNICRQLKENKLNFLDRCGNVFIAAKDFFITDTGYKESKTKLLSTNTRLFAKNGLKLIFNLLINPDLINSNYRSLANAGKIAIGSVRIILDGLVKNEFLIEDNGLKKLVNRKTLIDRWLTNYQDRLKPGLLIGRFRSVNGIINTEVFQNGKIFISGEFGADVLTNYLKPTVFEGYTSMTKQEIISELRLIPDNNGNIEFYNKFWQDNFSQNKNNLAPNLLIYTDLVISDNARNIETAGIIYDKYLQT